MPGRSQLEALYALVAVQHRDRRVLRIVRLCVVDFRTKHGAGEHQAVEPVGLGTCLIGFALDRTQVRRLRRQRQRFGRRIERCTERHVVVCIGVGFTTIAARGLPTRSV